MLELKDIAVDFDQPVLKGIDLTVRQQAIHGLLGKNGAGKTTLFRTVYGLIKPKRGTINIPGNLNRKDTISFLESEPYFYPYMKGHEYLKLISPEYSKIEFWNDIFQLPLNRFARDYSTGMKKKLAFMALLLQDKKVWILDEPFNGVDFETNEKMSQIILKAADKKIILIASHIIDKLIQICHSISVLDQGKISHSIPKEGFGQLTEMLRNEINNSISDKLNTIK